MIDMLQGQENIYYGFDEVEDDHNNFYPVKFLNSLTINGLPPQNFIWKTVVQ